MIKMTESELEDILEKFKQLIRNDKYTISSGENRLRNDNFIEINFLNKNRIKNMLLEITTKDCIGIDKHYKDNKKIVYKFIKKYNINTKADKVLGVYVKFTICLVRCQEHVIVISFHDVDKEEKYIY